MNLAQLWELPVLFVCENNLYAMGMPLEIAEAETEISQGRCLPHAGRGGGRHEPGRRRGGGRRAVDRSAPATVPISSNAAPTVSAPHSMFDAQLYRTREEIELWKERDPIPAR
jgi:pyruvate dehydrogenase E1 component alpha subunit